MKCLLIVLLIFSVSCSTLSPNALNSKNSSKSVEEGSKSLTFKKVLTFSAVCLGLYYLLEESEDNEVRENWSDLNNSLIF